MPPRPGYGHIAGAGGGGGGGAGATHCALDAGMFSRPAYVHIGFAASATEQEAQASAADQVQVLRVLHVVGDTVNTERNAVRDAEAKTNITAYSIVELELHGRCSETTSAAVVRANATGAEQELNAVCNRDVVEHAKRERRVA